VLEVLRVFRGDDSELLREVDGNVDMTKREEVAETGGGKREELRVTGKITGWETERGFGWVAYEGGSLLLHIREFEKGFVPRSGDEVSFVKGADFRGRPCAKDAKCPRMSPFPSAKSWMKLGLLLVLPMWANLRLPIAWWLLPMAMLPVSVGAWILFRHDKRLALEGRWRNSETELHGLEFFGGWPGAFLAQQKFRHKTRKVSYQAIFWAIVFLYQLLAIDVLTDHLMWNEVNAFLKEWMTPKI
jgi:uncharacterized membrane protein YsdA (DUF1294 family)/cold shock CspA family protein